MNIHLGRNRYIIISLLILLNLNASYGLSIVPPPNPEEPQPGDPDISALKDQHLVRLWEDTIIAHRRINPRGSVHFDPLYISTPKPADVQEYLITALERELYAEQIDWNTIHAIMRMMGGGMDADARIPELARYMLQLPRPIKLSDFRAGSYGQILFIIGNQRSAEAATLLSEAVERPFWGSDPMHTRAFQYERDSEKEIESYRSTALSALAKRIPQELSIPALRKLSEEYSKNADPEEKESSRIAEQVQMFLSMLSEQNE